MTYVSTHKPTPAPIATARLTRFLRRNPTLTFGATILTIFLVLALASPLLVGDVSSLNPMERLKPISTAHWLGTDAQGRDILGRTIYGARVSLLVGCAVAVLAITFGVILGLLAGYIQWLETPVMTVMDALMSIPAVLLAISLVSLTSASVGTVIVAITIPEIPRVVRLVRSVVLSVRRQPYVEAAVAGGARTFKILWRHILPATVPPLIVQATYVAASAILIESALSFVGAGTPPEIPSWGNMISESRLYLSRAPMTIFAPGLALALTVLAINLIGDGLRDRLDPKLARRM
ncbi:ABC transporter permease [Marinovum sp. 2_MG-2023]|uniref:ABC transporter permease n=1 Tax=unclassified Marinovum TaxID=2647166 RepID=UPI0026E33F06|nr:MULTISPECIES: ABC transporter permease [unclassified Marinovum]MDO6732575.1 ABC transporter permease [Marinovum sp. 2_MG-2023]MDO6782058.1 ABC transporter permease [Marinovum sp. 1_MG-2023]